MRILTDEELAKKIVESLGGKNNISSVTNCMTRVRIHLENRDEKFFSAVKNIDGVLGINLNGDELQIILMPGQSGIVANSIVKILRQSKSEKSTRLAILKIFSKTIQSIFIPIIPGFIACGLITCLFSIVTKFSPELANEPMIKLLSVAGNSVFYGLNLFVGYRAAKVLGGTPIIGGIIAAMINHPGLADINFFGENLLPGRGGIISVILIAAFTAQFEKFLRKFIPDVLDLFLTPLLTVLISGITAIFILQPIGETISNLLGTFITSTINSGDAFVGFILAGIWLPIVMFGVHAIITPIHLDLISQYGVTILLPILAMAGAGQVGASIAVYIKTKNKLLKKTIVSALPIGMLGIGEPLIYGVTFPLGTPFIGACLGGAVGGAFEAHSMVGSTTFGISGLPLAFTTNNISTYLFGILISYIAGFIATWGLGFEDPPEE